MENIKLRAKLSVYSKSVLPTKLSDLERDIDFITEPEDNGEGDIWVRKYGEWVKAEGYIGKNIGLDENSGLNLIRKDPEYLLSIRQKIIKDSDITDDFNYEDDTTYYIIDTKPEVFINGGTAFTDGGYDSILEEDLPSEYNCILSGGSSNQKDFDLILLPIDSKGVLYNGSINNPVSI